VQAVIMLSQVEPFVAMALSYNNVESTLLTFAILICLGGLMLQSERLTDSSYYSSERDVVSYLLIIIIILAILYYITVFIMDVVVQMRAEKMLAAKRARGMKVRRPSWLAPVGEEKDANIVANPMLRGENMYELRDAMAAQKATIESLRSEVARLKAGSQMGGSGARSGIRAKLMRGKKQFGQSVASRARGGGDGGGDGAGVGGGFEMLGSALGGLDD
jgi:hypothetical protein